MEKGGKYFFTALYILPKTDSVWKCMYSMMASNTWFWIEARPLPKRCRLQAVIGLLCLGPCTSICGAYASLHKNADGGFPSPWMHMNPHTYTLKHTLHKGICNTN
jgi:hypothetical protein